MYIWVSNSYLKLSIFPIIFHFHCWFILFHRSNFMCWNALCTNHTNDMICKLCLMWMETLNTKIVVNVRLHNQVFLSVFLPFRKTDWHFKIVQNWHFTYVYLNIFSCVSNIAVFSSMMFVLVLKEVKWWLKFFLFPNML